MNVNSSLSAVHCGSCTALRRDLNHTSIAAGTNLHEPAQPRVLSSSSSVHCRTFEEEDENEEEDSDNFDVTESLKMSHAPRHCFRC